MMDAAALGIELGEGSHSCLIRVIFGSELCPGRVAGRGELW